MAQEIATLVDAREGKRDRFQQEAGFSGRLAKLLNGERAWYLEDVERACDALGLDVVTFLAGLDVVMPSVTRWADSEQLAALRSGTEPGSETDDGQTP